jgi:FkbM family methyltransferase
MHGATGNIYCGLHEFEEMAFVLHFLRDSDLFVDVGANIGSYTILASGVCRARTIAIEPVDSSAAALAANVAFNKLHALVRVERCALGASSGAAKVSCASDCTNHVLGAGDAELGQMVRQLTLDELLVAEVPTLIKIDVEGYEYPVLIGGLKTLGSPELRAVIVEANGSGKRYGYTDEDVFGLLRAKGFKPYRYSAFSRTLTPAGQDVRSSGNVLFLRSSEFARERVNSAPFVKVLGQDL